MKTTMKRATITVMLVSFLLLPLGCSTSPDKISASYVSPLQYQHFSCNQLGGELLRVNRKVMEVTGQQQKEANKDAIAMGVGLVLFWPALFFMMGDDKKEELGRLKGEYDALEQVTITKDCDTAVELKEVRRQREEAETKRKEEAKISADTSFDDDLF
ncbi:MAG: hypothetical protein V3V95_04795 [Thermodesulfobacteriota bacterium]